MEKVTDQTPTVESRQKSDVCSHCLCSIYAGSTRCPECQSYLGRGSSLRNASGEVAALSLALALIALLVPTIRTLVPQHSKLVAAVLKTEGKTFEFMVSNDGNRPAAFVEAYLEYPLTIDGKKYHNSVRLDDIGFRPVVIEPEKAHRFASDTLSGLPPSQVSPGFVAQFPKQVSSMPKNCTLRIAYVEFDGETKNLSKRISARRVEKSFVPTLGCTPYVRRGRHC